MKNNELVAELKACVRREREATSAVLRLLLEVEKRRIYIERGFSSLFAFCRGELGYSEQEAFLRIQAMRLVKALPEVEAKIESGALSLTVAAMVQTAARREELPVARAEKLVEELAGASKREAERKLAAHFPEKARPETAREISDELVEIRFTVTREEMVLLQHLLDRKAHANFERKYDKLFMRLVRAEMSKLQNAQSKKPENAAPLLSPDKVARRYIPAATKRAIWNRDQGRCQYIAKNGRKCGEAHGLQIDHIQPFAQGGSHDASNLRLLCGAHNRARNSS